MFMVPRARKASCWMIRDQAANNVRFDVLCFFRLFLCVAPEVSLFSSSAIPTTHAIVA